MELQKRAALKNLNPQLKLGSFRCQKKQTKPNQDKIKGENDEDLKTMNLDQLLLHNPCTSQELGNILALITLKLNNFA